MSETDDPGKEIPSPDPSNGESDSTEISQTFGTEVSEGHRRRRGTFFKYSSSTLYYQADANDQSPAAGLAHITAH